MSDEQRVIRLVGDGKSGGGLPLPDAFGKILERLTDNQTASFEELVKVVSTEMEWTKERILTEWRSWKAFTRDLTDQLIERQMIAVFGTEDQFVLGKKFHAKRSMVIIPEADIKVTVYAEADRNKNEEIGEIISELNKLRGEVQSRNRLTAHVANLFDQFGRSLTIGKEPKNRGGRQQHGTPWKSEDEPEVWKMCTRCGEDFPLTTEYFEVYSSRGLFYRRAMHRTCWTKHLKERDIKKGDLKRSIKEAVNAAADAGDKLPSAIGLARELGSNDWTVRKLWDELTTEELAPPRARLEEDSSRSMAPPGTVTHEGEPCVRCGATERYTASGDCAPCSRARSAGARLHL